MMKREKDMGIATRMHMGISIEWVGLRQEAIHNSLMGILRHPAEDVTYKWYLIVRK